MSSDDEKGIADVRSFALELETNIRRMRREFEGKTWFGLWWDSIKPHGQKSFFMKVESSDKRAVVEQMEKYQQFYGEIALFTDQINKSHENANEDLRTILQKLQEMERDAECDVDTTTSKTVYEMLMMFLSTKKTLDYKLQKVERFILRKNFEEVKEICPDSFKIADLNEDVKNLRKEKDELKKVFLEKIE